MVFISFQVSLSEDGVNKKIFGREHFHPYRLENISNHNKTENISVTDNKGTINN